jgi:hypothetical protein
MTLKSLKKKSGQFCLKILNRKQAYLHNKKPMILKLNLKNIFKVEELLLQSIPL